MGVLAALRKMIYQEEVKYKAGISESTATKIGQAINFINQRQHSEKQFFLNGLYGFIPAQSGIDGLTVFEFDAEIINVYAFNLVKGSAGTTEMDLKISTAPGNDFTSIFSTTPKIASTANNNAWLGIGDALTGCVAPVFNGVGAGEPYPVDAGSALRFDTIQHMTAAQNCGLLVHYRPR